ncbi:SpoIIE family protein phosphatase [Blastopirellula marina]|uniref:Protein serine phosphatase n=1 Tax=Blastopirellula marina TaxID=124 RepID=A0A2S8GG38_9BACT|nr:SpoIIE family protein phosphatase [Blastopirellula marina]PQO43393.1 protein serine phosphatase [Blastopirellula marina]PTL46707.1 protein serine phosphatase [Blastopirellula marina]
MSSYLVAVNGSDAGKKIYLTGEKYVMGRHPECDIVVDAGAVSRHHAQITRKNQDLLIEDLGSRNGTFVNDSAIHSLQKLKDGDLIRVCDVTFTFHLDQPFAPPSARNLAQREGGGAYGTIMVDDDSAPSTIMSQLEVSSQSGGVSLQASAEVKLAAMLEITKNLGGVIAPEDVFPQVLESLFKIFLQADRSFIILQDEKGRLTPRWTKTRRPGDENIRISRTVINHVIEKKQAILSADAAADSRFEMSQSITDFQIRSIMCAPLIDSEGKAFGALQIDTLDQRKRFQQEDLEVLMSVATQAAISIDNAQLHQRAMKQQEIERDLKLASQVQIGFLPKGKPAAAGYDFFDYYRAANSVGGDYYDYIPLPNNRMAILLGDVVGHGIAASLLMAKLSADARYTLASIEDPAEAFSTLNNTFSESIPDDQFVTLVLNILDFQAHELTVLNAGHMAPMLRRNDGQVEDVGEAEISLPLGVFPDLEYEKVTVPIAVGERIILFTDGINEAMDADGQQFGIPRVRERAQQEFPTVAQLGQAVVQDVREFMGSQFDDMCLVCYERLE